MFVDTPALELTHQGRDVSGSGNRLLKTQSLLAVSLQFTSEQLLYIGIFYANISPGYLITSLPQCGACIVSLSPDHTVPLSPTLC